MIRSSDLVQAASAVALRSLVLRRLQRAALSAFARAVLVQ